jgi:hypothetical protein
LAAPQSTPWQSAVRAKPKIQADAALFGGRYYGK